MCVLRVQKERKEEKDQMKSALMCGSSSSSFFFVCARVQTMSPFSSSSSSDYLSFFSSSLSLRHNLSGHTYPKQRTGLKRGTPPLSSNGSSQGGSAETTREETDSPTPPKKLKRILRILFQSYEMSKLGPAKGLQGKIIGIEGK